MTQLKRKTKAVLRQCNWHLCSQTTLRCLHVEEHESGHLEYKKKTVESVINSLFLQTYFLLPGTENKKKKNATYTTIQFQWYPYTAISSYYISDDST